MGAIGGEVGAATGCITEAIGEYTQHSSNVEVRVAGALIQSFGAAKLGLDIRAAQKDPQLVLQVWKQAIRDLRR